MRKRDSKVTREKTKATAAVRTRTRNRHDDVKSLGPSRLVPYDPAEPDSDRHWRRLESAIAHRGSVEMWCRERGMKFATDKAEQHWVFIKAGARGRLNESNVAHWCPAPARLVFGSVTYKVDGVHAHDVEQVKAEITRRWELAQ